MGIKFNCPNGHKLNVKSFLAGRRGICPHCDARFRIPQESGGVAELVQKGDRGGDATQLTDAMQDDVNSGDAGGNYPQTASYEESFGSPLGTVINTKPWSGSAATGSTTSSGPQYGSPVTANPAMAYPVKSSDPLDENPQAVWYVRPRSGGQYGPAVGEIMRDWIREGRVAGDSYVWREGWTDWRSASSVFPQLAGLLSTGTSPVAGPAGVGQPMAGSFPTGGSFPIGNVAAGGVPVAGPVAGGTGVPVLGALPASGMANLEAAAPAPLSSSVKKKIDPRRRNSDFTALIVMLLVVIAVVLVGVFAWVLFGRPSESTAQILPKIFELARVAETLRFTA